MKKSALDDVPLCDVLRDIYLPKEELDGIVFKKLHNFQKLTFCLARSEIILWRNTEF